MDRLLALTVYNPIIVQSARSRLRLKQLIPWAVVLLTVTGFVTSIVYVVQIEETDLTVEQASRVTLLPIIIVQAVLLMILGTGAVAAGVSQDREDGLLDYHRLTPMPPSAKLIGYLFGLPIREYVLFAMTLPFLMFGIIRGGFPLSTVLHFYLIFFSSVIVYHMTGIVAGMLSKRPRHVAFVSYFLVLILYFALPNLSHIGFTFFEFLTIRPALFGLITQEIEGIGGAAEAIADSHFTALDSFRDIPFFSFTIQPGLYSLLVQGGLVLSLWTIAYRKWRNDTALPFSKIFSVVFFSGVAVFVLGSTWPILKDDAVLAQLMGNINQRVMEPEELRGTEYSMSFSTIMLCVSIAIMMLTGALCILCSTPSVHRIRSGARRAARQGRAGIPMTADESSGMPWIAACVVIGGGVYGVLAMLAMSAERFMGSPPLFYLALPALFLVVLLVFLQAGLERYGPRATFVSVFLLWMVPFFSAILLAAAVDAQTLSAYVSVPFPPASLAYMGLELFSHGVADLAEDGDGPAFIEHLPALAVLPVVLYGGLGLPLVASAMKRNRRLMATARSEEAA